jgi:hypothetical protein
MRSEQIANNPAQAEAAARTKVSDLLESLARDLTKAAADYGTVGWRLAAILSEVDVPVLATPLTDHCVKTVAAAGKIARELQRAADDVREGSRHLPKVSPPPADHPSFWVEGGGST